MHFRNIIGHQKQLELISRDLEDHNLAHAYLFAGPADLGKFTIAKLFAKAIQIHEEDEETGFNLSSQIDRGIHLDTIFMPRSPEEESIKIATVRSLLNNLQMTGVSRQRILVMEDIDRLTTEAANAMLKMIEEPPSRVIYIFTSSNPNQILETILSRVRRVDFSILDENTMQKGVLNRYRLASPEKISKVMELSMGRIAKAIKLMDNQEILEVYENIYLEIRDFLKNRDISKAFAFIGQIHSDNLLTKIFLEIAEVVLREEIKQLQINSSSNQAIILKRIDNLFEILKLADTNVNNRLLLENFILSL